MRQANDLGKPYAGKLHVRFDEGVKEVRTENVGLPLYRLLLLFYSTALWYATRRALYNYLMDEKAM